MVVQVSSWAWLKGHVVSSGAPLRVEMLSEVVIGRLDLLVDVWSTARVVVLAAVETEVAMRLVHMVDVVLLLLVHLPCVLVLEDLGENALRAGRLARVVLPVAIRVDAHSASMHSVELILYVSISPRRPSGASSARVAAMLLNRWPRDIQLCSLARYEVLCLITAGLRDESLTVRVSAHRTGVNGLPGVLLSIDGMSVLDDVVDDCAALVTPRLAFALTLLLSDESHRQLADVDRMVRVLMVAVILINQVEVQIVHSALVVRLNRPEPPTVDRAISVAVVRVPRALARLIGGGDVVVEA